MLETLREYGNERLAESGEAERVQRGHALYFLGLAEASVESVWGSEEAVLLEERIEEEHDNLRAALKWAIRSGDAEVALRLAASIAHFWELRGYLSEGRSWLQAALSLVQSLKGNPFPKGNPGLPSNDMKGPMSSVKGALVRAHALWRAGMLAVRQRDYGAAWPLLDESRGIYRGAGDKENLVKVLNVMAVATLDTDYETALAIHSESLALRRELGDKSKIAATLHNMSFIKMHQGKWDEALELSQESQGLFRELDAQLGVAYTHYVQGNVASGQGNQEGALAHLQECLEGCRQMKSNIMLAWTLNDMGGVLYRQGELERANSVLIEARDTFIEVGDVLGLANVLVQLGRDAFRRGEYAKATSLYESSLSHAIDLDNQVLGGAALAGFAGIAVAMGQAHEGALLFGCAQGLLEGGSTSLERRAMTLGLDEACATLGEGAWQVAWDEGVKMGWEEAVALARRVALSTLP
jgi:tetratricopeptide (TPR) repeat protein